MPFIENIHVVLHGMSNLLQLMKRKCTIRSLEDTTFFKAAKKQQKSAQKTKLVKSESLRKRTENLKPSG